MRNPYYTPTGTKNFAKEVLELHETVESQRVAIDELLLKAAYYKANFFQRYDLAEKLINQIEENHNYCIGEFDGFCFASWRARAQYRTLNLMCLQGLITKEEYDFCDV